MNVLDQPGDKEFAEFLAACLDAEPAARTTARDLYQAYQCWARRSRIEAMTATAFGRQLTDHGYFRVKRGIVFYHGVRLSLAAQVLRRRARRRSSRNIITRCGANRPKPSKPQSIEIIA